MSKFLSGGIIAAASVLVLLVLQAGAQISLKTPLIVHEWGTFTALQDDDGRALGAINADDEPVPDFVERIGYVRDASPRGQLTPGLNSKGISPCHPDVTMRLETPVIYFYPPTGESSLPADAVADVRVSFRGGWLTEFYPRAKVEAPDLLDVTLDDATFQAGTTRYPALRAESVSSLNWDRLQLSAQGDLVQTDDPVWTAPRAVKSAMVKGSLKNQYSDGDHAEKFVFYRGVGHINSPLRAVCDPGANTLQLHADLSAMGPRERFSKPMTDLHVPAAWLVEIRPGDGFCAFRPVAGPMDLQGKASGNDESVALVSEGFAPGDFSAGRLQELRDAMHKELVTAGLFPDEAAAMLKTWELSYFKSPGRRLFYVTPRGWTEEVLPLSIDGARITRVMIGRIEFITSAQRELLTHIANGPCPDMKKFGVDYYQHYTVYFQAMNQRQAAGEQVTAEMLNRPSFADLKVAVPPIYQAYLDLGRFRDALLLDEQRQRPTAALKEFIAGNDLAAVSAPGLAAK